MTNGCFDIVHSGHINYLNESKKLGDFLIVAVNSDKSVRQNKGKNYLVNNLLDRMKVLESLKNVDCVVSFNEKTPRNLYKKIMPDIITKGGDYKESEVIGKNEIAKNGGKVVIINYLKNYSSSSIKNKIIKIKKKSLR